MNPNRRPFDDPSGEPGAAHDAGDAGNTTLTTWPSRSSLQAPSFQAADDAGTEAFPFPPLADSPTAPSPTWRRRPSSIPSIRQASPASRDHPDLNRRPSRNPSIRIRRRSNVSLRTPSERSSVPEFAPENIASNTTAAAPRLQIGRPRSASHPERGEGPRSDSDIARHSRAVPQVAMPRLTEEGTRPTMEELGLTPTPLSPTRSLPEEPIQHTAENVGMVRKMSRFFWPARGDGQQPQTVAEGPQRNNSEYDDQLVDWLDTVDPEVQTLSTLTNIQNSLFVPDLGHWINRRPTYILSENDAVSMRPRPVDEESRPEVPEPEKETGAPESLLIPPPIERTSTISSRLTDSHYAALPHGTSLEGWSAEEKAELDDHVRHMLHSRRSKFKRTMKGFGQYVRRPLGFFVTLYATLITLFGLAWVLFLIGWIYVGEEQVYAIHIIDSVLVALFAIVGDGLAPFRAIDTYRMIHIAHYSRIIKNAKNGKLQKRRSRLQKQGITPELRESMDRWHSIDPPGVPSNVPVIVEPEPAHPRSSSEGIAPEEQPGLSREVSRQDFLNNSPGDLEAAQTHDDDEDLWPLTPAQRKKFRHQQKKLAKSHSFYKPHETSTHSSFPLSYLIAIVVLLDCHSCLQISLGACTWGIDYHTRPFAITTVILCVSITCNITAGLVITAGDRKTRKKEVHNLMNRQELTGDAIKKIDKKRNKEQREGEDGNLEKKKSPRFGRLSKERSE